MTAIAGGYAHTVALLGGVPLLPSLQARPSGNQLILAWPTNAAGFTLQSTLSLIPPVIWMDSTNPPVVNGAQFIVTNTFSTGAKYFRLRKP